MKSVDKWQVIPDGQQNSLHSSAWQYVGQLWCVSQRSSIAPIRNHLLDLDRWPLVFTSDIRTAKLLVQLEKFTFKFKLL